MRSLSSLEPNLFTIRLVTAAGGQEGGLPCSWPSWSSCADFKPKHTHTQSSVTSPLETTGLWILKTDKVKRES